MRVGKEVASMLIKKNLNKMVLLLGGNLENVKKNLDCVLNVALERNSVMDCKNLPRSHVFENLKFAG